VLTAELFVVVGIVLEPVTDAEKETLVEETVVTAEDTVEIAEAEDGEEVMDADVEAGPEAVAK